MTLLVFSDDWGRHPTSCQHLIRHLLPRYPVVWVNMIGMRRPKLEWYTVTRGFEKLGQWLGPKKPPGALPDNLKVISPVVWPGFGLRLERGLNAKLLSRQLRQMIQALPEPPIAITTMPTVADLIGRINVKKWIYYCVDDFTTWPGLDHRAVAALEDQLIERANGIIAVSENLQGRVATLGRRSELLTHGVELDFWRMPMTTNSLAITAPPPWIVFWGLIDRRMDVQVLQCLNDADLGSVILAGPEDNPDPLIKELPRVHRIGPVPPEQLPGLAEKAAVLILPYADLRVTRAIQPLKLKEYLATGKPVVARNLPAVCEWADALDAVADAAAFVDAVRSRVSSEVPASQKSARQRLEAESWARKSEQFLQFVLNS
jgi:glycosyltransferase involved in cell wall biosynthesis